MDLQLIFQLVASAAALTCSGASLTLWLLSIEPLDQRPFGKKLLIIGQAVIGGVIITGLVVSCYLAIQQANFKTGLLWAILQLDIGCLLLLLILNESRLTHILVVLSFVGTLVILLLSTSSPEHRNIFRLSFMIISLASLSFVHVQFIRFWMICVKPRHMHTNAFKLFWRHPCYTAPKHQQALWVASIGSIGLFLLLLGSTILACAKPCLWTQLTTFQVAIISLRKVAVSAYLLGAPECNTVTVEV
ncbi:hypothetical protein BDW59DRAFT_179171 [Aspergillus cavernicola]|uniref:Uncharacterized protein n=1 Tax=Aspergillus cavernicola TaxID=176166 RepID=A0ABR4H9I7_9EURO